MGGMDKGDARSAALLPLMAVVLAAFLVIGIAMPVLPLHVHDGLGLGPVMVGLVAGSQFAASLISRPWAGNLCDRRGAKRAVVAGLLGAAASGLFYIASLAVADRPQLSGAILVLGRLLLGVAESTIITGAVNWGLALAGPQNTGRVIAWMGAAMFAAFALGAPLGAAMYDLHGFGAVAAATTLAPLATLLLVAPLQPTPAASQTRPSFICVLGAVWLPGLGAALGSIAFGAITAFLTLLFAISGWSHGWLPYSIFAATFIVARFALGHLPDHIGGAKVALVCLLIEALGLALIGWASGPVLAMIGAALAGLGYSLVYPGFGVEAVMRVPAQNRGLAMGAYTAFLDLALGVSGPLLGLIASGAAIGAVFLVGALFTLAALPIALRLLLSPHQGDADEKLRAVDRVAGPACRVRREGAAHVAG